MKVLIVSVVLCSCLIATAAHREADGNFIDDKVSLTRKGPGGVSIKVSIVRAAWSSKSTHEGGGYWGAATKRPKSVISRLAVNVDGEKAYIPISAFGDLAEPLQVRQFEDGRNWKLEILGGSGADAYSAVLTFDNAGWILKRRVQSVEMSSDVWEETRYSFMKAN